MNSTKSKEVSEEILRRELESKMTEEERILAARMAKIAEMAEKKNSSTKSNTIIKELVSSKVKTSETAATTQIITEPGRKKIVYLSKAQREKNRLEEEERKKKELEKQKQKVRPRNVFSIEEEQENERKRQIEIEAKRKRQRNDTENNDDDKYRKALEVDIKKQYLGEVKKPCIAKQRKNVTFMMQWRNEDDTSETSNPLYMQPAKAHIGFGKGYIGGVDMRTQRKSSKYMESLLSLRRQADMESADATANSDALNQQLLQNIRQKDMEKDETVKVVKKEGAGRGSHWSEKELSDMTDRDWRIMREDFEIRVQGARAVNPLRFWNESGVHPAILKAIDKLGYKEPSPIQRQAIPIELKGKDLIGIAKTGSGKTCAFVVPMLEYVMRASVESRIKTREQGPLALIMAPTRELAKQILEETQKLAEFCYDERLKNDRDCRVKAVCVVGGESILEQTSLTHNGCDILIGTPGRLQDCLDNCYIVLNQTNYIVLDEADRMIDDGFEQSVNKILSSMGSVMKSEEEEEIDREADENESLTNMYRTTIMFSATMAPKVEQLARKYMRCPVQVNVGSSNQTFNIDITQIVNLVKPSQKPTMLDKVIRNNKAPFIVFCNQRDTVDSVAKILSSNGHRSVVLRAGISQEQRERALADFREGRYDILVATDVAARGLDVKGVQVIVNYDMPTTFEYYIHRIGRTGRAGATGLAISFATEEDSALFPEIVDYLKKKNQAIPDELERHQAVRDAGKFSKSGDTDGANVDPTEFKMI